MFLLPYIHTWVAAITLCLAVFVLLRTRRNRLGSATAVLLFTMVLWSLINALIQTPSIGEASVMRIQAIFCFGWMSIPPALLWFTLVATERRRTPALNALLAAMVAGSLFVVISQLAGRFSYFTFQGYGWAMVWPTGRAATYVFLAMSAVSVGMALAMFRSRSLLAPTLKKRNQAASLFAAVAAASVAGFGFGVVAPLAGLSARMPDLSDLAGFILAVGITHAIIKYRFLEITPAMAAPNIIAAMHDGLAIIDWDGRIVTVNESLSRLLGYGPDELIGKQGEILFAGRAGRSAQDFLGDLFLESARTTVDSVMLASNGDEIPVAVSVSLIRDRESNSVAGIVLVARDMRELRRLQARLLRAEKLSAIGELAGNLAHEINNPMGIILGFAQIAVRGCFPGDPLFLPLKSIEREAIRCKKLVGDLLVFSRLEKSRLETGTLNEIVEQTLLIIEAYARGKNVRVIFNPDPAPLPITVNSLQVQEVLVNLCNNAVDAMSCGGSIAISVKHTGGKAQLIVRDTGCGIPAGIRDRIFEPFFSTKEAGGGTGLGLSLCHEIVSKHNGTIEVQSTVGAGSTFTVTLPAEA